MTTVNERRITIVNPLTGEVSGSVPITEPSNVAEIVTESRRVFDTWGTLSPQDRRPLIRRGERSDLSLFREGRIRDTEHEHEAVELRVGQRVRALLFDRVLGG